LDPVDRESLEVVSPPSEWLLLSTATVAILYDMAKTETAALRSPKQLGSAVWEMRVLRGLSQDELAERSKISKFTISRLENGVSWSDLETLRRICQAFGITVVQLLQKAEQI